MSINTPGWVKDAIFYQIFPDRFARSERAAKPAHLETWESPPTTRGFKGGDLFGIQERLDYLKSLGITAIYLNPIFQSAANHRYHTHDYFHVDPILGGDAAFRSLLQAAHARGIRVVLDGVFNHASRGFLQFNHLLENGAASPYRDWFSVSKFPLNAFDEDQEPNYDCWWGMRELPKLNTDNPQVRDFLFEVAEFWIRQGIDGWRLDVPLEIKTPGFWEEFRQRVKALNPEAYILAEIWDDARDWLQGSHFDAVMNYPFNRACLGFFGGPMLNTEACPGGYQLQRLNARTFARQIDRLLTLYDGQVTQVQFNLLSSHDEPRFLTLVQGEKQRLQLATLFQMAFPGTPSIYYGDEIGMEGGEDPDCRRTFCWEQQSWDTDLLATFQQYIALRQAHPALRRGSYITLHAEGTSYVFARQTEAETLIVALNVGAEVDTVALHLNAMVPAAAVLTEVWSEEALALQDGNLDLTLPGISAKVLYYQAN